MTVQQPSVTYCGAFDMQVCVPVDWDDHQILAFAEGNNPCGTEDGWSIRRQGDPSLDGANERAPCVIREGFVHIMLDA